MSIETFIDIPKQEKKDYSEDQFYYEMIGPIDKYWRNFDNLQREKNRFIEKYPERAQEIEIFFDFPENCQIRQEIKDHVKWEKGTAPQKYENLTEWNFLTTNYLLHNIKNEKGAGKFWSALRPIAMKNFRDGFELWATAKSGNVAQTAAIAACEQFKPSQTTPFDDKVNAKDLILHSPYENQEVSVQVKTKKDMEELDVTQVECINYPSISVKDINFSTVNLNEAPHTKMPLELLKELYGKKKISFEIDLPKKMYNPLTGEPTEECIEKLGQKIENIINKYR